MNDEERKNLIRARKQAYDALEELCTEIKDLEEMLKPMILERTRLRQRFTEADIALAKITRVEVDLKARNYKAPSQPKVSSAQAKELLSLLAKFNGEEIAELMQKTL